MVKNYSDFKLLFSLIVFFIILMVAGNGLATSFIETAQVPCYVKIAAGGELRVPIDTHRKADLEIRNQAKKESVCTVIEYRNGKPRKGFQAEPSTLDKNTYRKEWRFNRYFEQTPPSSVVDEVRITVEKGLVSAKLGQTGENRKDFYNNGYQHGTFVDPKRPLTVHITGDDPLGNKTSGKFWMEYEAGGYSGKTLFTVKTGKTLTWDYPTDKGVKGIEVDISKGQAKISLVQPPYHKKAATKQSTVKKTSKQKYKPKIVTQFTVTHPYGTSKPVSPDKDLMVTVTGVSGAASGTIDLYSDRKKIKKIDALKFKLKKKQAKSFAVSGKKNVGWATVWVHKGSFKVKLDQSPNAKAVPTPKTKKTTKTKKSTDAVSGTAASTPKTNKGVAADSGAGKQTASSGTILNGEVPLYKGARVVKTKSYGVNSTAELQVDATPQELVDFYKQAMSAKGWKTSMAMVQGNMGILQLKKNGGQLVFKVEGRGDASSAKIVLINQ